MMIAMMRKLFAVLLITIPPSLAYAQPSGADQQAEAAANAANPLAFVTKLQVQPNYPFLDGGGDQLSLINRIIQPARTVEVPFIKSQNPAKVYTIYRLEFPVVSQTISSVQPLNATGVSDLIFYWMRLCLNNHSLFHLPVIQTDKM
ncbi:MAG: hypothetical protein ACREOO_25910 [bacterium]